MKMNECPKWCETEHKQTDAYMGFHWGLHYGIDPVDREVSIRGGIRVDAYMESLQGKARPATVSFGAYVPGHESILFTDLPPGDARVIASVIETLSGATPDQQSEYVAGIRAAASAIENEAEAG